LSCVIGSWGWRHPEWDDDVFYPHDLPREWRLSYYANEFHLVMVPAAYWLADGSTEEDWLDDVSGVFTFYIDWPFLQLSDLAAYENCAQQCLSLGQQLAAVLVDGDIWQKLSAEQKQWFKAVTEPFRRLQYNAVTDAEFAAVYDDQLAAAGEQLLLLHSDSNESLRELGGRLNQLLQTAAQKTDEAAHIKHIILSGQSVDIQRLKELDTLVTLLNI